MAVDPSLVNYGLDWSCTWRTQSFELPDGSTQTLYACDLEENGLEVTGRTLLAEAISRRLSTFRGTLIDDPDYGFDVTQYVNDDIDARTLGELAAGCDAEAKKDERVLDSSTTATLAGGVLILAMSLRDLAGPFRLTLSVSDVGVQILQVR